MTSPADLRRQLKDCPPGLPGWRLFEDACTAALRFLFEPPLHEPIVQPRTFSGIDRRDLVFPNWNLPAANNWGKIYEELAARLILFEFKNFDHTDIGKAEVNQTRNYLTKTMGRLAIMCCNMVPNSAAHIKRNSIFSEDKKVILFITTDHLIEMLGRKEIGQDPSDVIIDSISRFYLQHE